MTTPPRVAALLWILSALFLFRVVAQILVEFVGGDAILPPSREWESGLLPYPLLLLSQLLILAVMLRINLGVTRRRGFCTTPHPRLARFLVVFATLYAAGMAIRYFVSGELHPQRRFWPPGTIPIAFHFVLAIYLFTLARLARDPVTPTAKMSS